VIGQTMPYSARLSASPRGRAQAAYFAMINERGGVNGRKIKLISLDDGYSPPRTVEQTRKLVESEQVLVLFSSFGTPPNVSVLKYLNAKRVPQLFIAATDEVGISRQYPRTTRFSPASGPAALHVHYVLENKPRRIGILPERRFRQRLPRAVKDLPGDKAARMIVSEQAYESTDRTVDRSRHPEGIGRRCSPRSPARAQAIRGLRHRLAPAPVRRLHLIGARRRSRPGWRKRPASSPRLT
jgi:hypothetical protein